MNRLRRARHWVTGAAPQPVLEDRDIYCPGHRPLYRPGPNPASLIAESKPRSPAGPKNIPFPSTAAPSPHGKHIWDLRYKRPKLQLTAGRKQERLRHHHPEPGETLGDAWSHSPPARLGPRSPRAHSSSSAARTARGTASSRECKPRSILGDFSHHRGSDATERLPLNTPWQHTRSRFSPFSIPWALAQSGAPQIAPNANFAWRRRKHKSPGTHHLL